MNTHIAKILIFVGVFLVIAGIILLVFTGRETFLGRLPGDILIERENFRFYFPVTSAILISVIISVLLYVIRRFF